MRMWWLFLMLGLVAPVLAAKAVTVAVVSPEQKAIVGGPALAITTQVTHPAEVTVREVQLTLVEIGVHAYTLSYAAFWPLQPKHATESAYQVTVNTLPMHNGPCAITARAICEQGEQTFTVESAPITIWVTNLWITDATPRAAFFTVRAGEEQIVRVTFDHYRWAGPYRVTYTFRDPAQNMKILRTVVHDNVRGHADSYRYAPSKAEAHNGGAYVCYNVTVESAREGDRASYISPTCRVLHDDFTFAGDEATGGCTFRVVYTLSTPPGPEGLSILAYSNLRQLCPASRISDQQRNWDRPVLLTIPSPLTGLRTIFLGCDNRTDNRGRRPQHILPEG